MTIILDTSACQIAQPLVDCSEEALGFVTTLSVVIHDTLTKIPPMKNSHVASIDHAWTDITENRDSKEVIQL